MLELVDNSETLILCYKVIKLLIKLAVTHMICKNKKLSDEKVKYITSMFSKTKS